ncbi:unnamed protein product [Caenorhabditis nigoni]
MPFPILRTPLVVLSEIISLLEPNEIVTASFCSNNVKRLLKTHYQRRKPVEWKLFLVDSGGYSITIKTSKSRIEVISAKNVSELYTYPKPMLLPANGYITKCYGSYVYLYFEDRLVGKKMVVDYATNLFNLDVYGLQIDCDSTIWAIDWINERQEKMLAGVEFTWNFGDRVADKEFDHVLRNARASEYWILKGNVSDHFRFNGKLGTVNYLVIEPFGHWVTLDNLINFDAISIFIIRCRLSVSDLYSFIRHWRTGGGSRRLTFLRMEFQNRLNIENFEDEVEIVGRDVSGEYLSCGETRHFSHGYSIQRNDGVKAVIDIEDNCCFYMMVCIGENIYDRDNYLDWKSDQHFVLHQKV